MTWELSSTVFLNVFYVQVGTEIMDFREIVHIIYFEMSCLFSILLLLTSSNQVFVFPLPFV